MPALTKQTYCNIQYFILPLLEEEIGVLSDKGREFASLLELVRPGDHLRSSAALTGRPCHGRAQILNALFLKSVENIPTTKGLIGIMRSDSSLRRLCGWDFASDVPSEATFSRAFAEFSASGVLDRIHDALIKNAYKEKLVGHISHDSTSIENRERPAAKKMEKGAKVKKKRGRKSKAEKEAMKAEPPAETRTERQSRQTLDENVAELPKDCDWGGKRNSKGVTNFWSGYKLHLSVADGGVPVSALLTSASLHDSQAVIPMMQKCAGRVTSLYDLCDAAYDTADVKGFSIGLGHVPVIDANRRQMADKPEMDFAKQERYCERSTVERCNSDLKDNYGARFVRFRGWQKVFCHLMLGVVAVAAKQLFNMLC